MEQRCCIFYIHIFLISYDANSHLKHNLSVTFIIETRYSLLYYTIYTYFKQSFDVTTNYILIIGTSI